MWPRLPLVLTQLLIILLLLMSNHLPKMLQLMQVTNQLLKKNLIGSIRVIRALVTLMTHGTSYQWSKSWWWCHFCNPTYVYSLYLFFLIALHVLKLFIILYSNRIRVSKPSYHFDCFIWMLCTNLGIKITKRLEYQNGSIQPYQAYEWQWQTGTCIFHSYHSITIIISWIKISLSLIECIVF